MKFRTFSTICAVIEFVLSLTLAFTGLACLSVGQPVAAVFSFASSVIWFGVGVYIWRQRNRYVKYES